MIIVECREITEDEKESIPCDLCSSFLYYTDADLKEAQERPVTEHELDCCGATSLCDSCCEWVFGRFTCPFCGD